MRRAVSHIPADKFRHSVILEDIEQLPELAHVLICRHIAEDNYTGQFGITAGGRFIREDRTEGMVTNIIACLPCTDLDLTDVTCLEYFWRNGRFHLVDDHICHECQKRGEPRPVIQ